MKSIRMKMADDELIFFGQGVFKGDEDLIVFSLEEFLIFRRQLKRALREANWIVENSRNNKSGHGPTVDAQRILNFINKMEDEIERLYETDVQKNLKSY
ncbi:MAG: hypothetical protein Q8M06_00520 [Methanobacteriaceae archaeon]|nr:hypothetical protein [Methanobacteriaceae archaeon]MDZ4172833.1 hypothetical protein [Methanobacteriaceae archaeon]